MPPPTALVDVQVIMPIGSEPHDFAPSARQAETMENADLLVTNGAGFEAGMTGVIENVADERNARVRIRRRDRDRRQRPPLLDRPVVDRCRPRRARTPTRRPSRASTTDALAANVDAYQSELDALQDSIEQTVAAIPEPQRTLVTNHEVFNYYAARFGFDVVGAVIPSLSTDAEPSAAGLEALADTIRAEGVTVIFGETTQSTEVAEALADEVGEDVEIVELFSESLGDDGSGAETYLAMMTTNTELITAAFSA